MRIPQAIPGEYRLTGPASQAPNAFDRFGCCSRRSGRVHAFPASHGDVSARLCSIHLRTERSLDGLADWVDRLDRAFLCATHRLDLSEPFPPPEKEKLA